MRVAIVGIGSAGCRHLKAFQSIGDAIPIAVSSRPDCVNRLEADGVSAVGSIAEAVDSGATLAVIASRTGSHVDQGLAALEAGCDLLVEKPLGLDAVEANRLVRAAAAGGRKLYVGCVLRFSDSLNTFRIRFGQVGPPHAIVIECRSYLPDWRRDRPYRESYSVDAFEGGVLRDLIHEVDYAGWLFGWPTSVNASLRNHGVLGIDAEETADLSWETTDGCRITLALDYLSRPPRRSLTVFGSEGAAHWDGIANSVRIESASGRNEVEQSVQTRDEMFRAQALAFVGATDGPEAFEAATGEDGVRALAVCDAARRASETSSVQQVKYL